MRLYLLGSDSTVGGIYEKGDIKGETSNENYGFNTEVLAKHEPSCDLLNIHNTDELFQDDDYQKRLFPPDIFKLNKLVECTSSSKTDNLYTEKLCTSRALKRILVEDESSAPKPSPKKIELKPIVEDGENNIFAEESITALDFKTEQNHSTGCKLPGQQIIKKELCIKLYRCGIKQSIHTEKICNSSFLSPVEQVTEKIAFSGDELPSISPGLRKTGIKQILPKENTVKKNLILKLYARSNLWHTKTNSGVLYRNAIKKINIDENGFFKNTILEKIGEITKRRDLLKSSIDLYPTYSNIRKFALNKVYSLFDDNAINLDMLITPGMSISDIRSACISNNIFFKKLQKYCEKVAEDVLAAPASCLAHIFQSYANFNLKNYFREDNIRIKISHKKNKFLPALKELIIKTIYDLPNSIVCELEKTDKKNIVDALFVDLHGALASKSLIKNLNLLFKSNKNKFANKRFYDDLNLFDELLEKTVSIVRSSCIFHEGVFLPDEPTAEKLSRYLLSDMYGMPLNFHKKIKFPDKNTLKIDNFILDSNYARGASAIKTETSSNCNNDQSEQRIMIKEFNLKSYYKADLFSADNTSNIYEDATKKISIDSNCRFKNRVLEELGHYIISRGFIKSSLDLSKTYSNIRKYVLHKVSPFINDAMTTTDELITPGIHLSDLSRNLISNSAFFEKLSKNCEEIAKSINFIPNDYFSSIIQSYIYLSPTERLRVNKKKKKLCPELKLIIIETISNLTNNIVNELKKFKPNEIIDGLFTNIHDVYLPKTLIRNLELILNSNNMPGNKYKPNLNLLNNLFKKVLSEVEICPILHEEKIFSIERETAKILSKYLLSDMYSIPVKIQKKLILHKHTEDDISESNHEKSSETNNDNNMEPSLLEKSIIIPQKKLKWGTKWGIDIISPLNIYKLDLSMIDIDKDDFECYFIDKIRKYPSVTKHLGKNEKINVDLSITYSNVKNYIFETFSFFLKDIEEETRSKIKLTNGMTLDELRLTYVSKEFLCKFHEFCTEAINRINSCRNTKLTDLIQFRIHLGTEMSKSISILMNKERKNRFLNEITNLLVKNILNTTKVIVNTIKLISNNKFMDEHFSNFYDIYVDNVSLLKAKSVFDSVHKRVANDHLLIKIADKISLNMIHKNSAKKHIVHRIINKYMVCRGLSTYDYIRKLIKEDIPTLEYNLGNTIMIIRNDKIQTADQKTRYNILMYLESDLIETTIKLYNKLCTKKCMSHK
ncbi:MULTISPECIES: hypothetical protein [Candidatus Ichthyocystis]|uniref:Uncharacterized protein n=1 Tax=Candidatus Ichthyocystis hellenicum TaxID=1561003 RepID=A0A0S4M3D2_9BURK|nr:MULTISPECIES: hypothetical protein [Ichthyocystis]CUT18277.1 hypothetical protein Ark11_1479 [Candidatus Ichthyocystis hellenicum]